MARKWRDYLSYKTPKFVDIKDPKLGVISILLKLAILVKIGVMTVWKNCEHLKPVPVFGSARANAQMPTEGGCDPSEPGCRSSLTPLSQLPYCDEYGRGQAGGPNKTLEAANTTRPLKVTRCEFWDEVSMTRGRSPVPGTIFLPTRVSTFYEIDGCEPTDINGYSCDPMPFVRDLNNKQNSNPHMFTADVERFTLLVNHAIQALDADGHQVSGRAADFPGVIDPSPRKSRQYLDHKAYNGTIMHTTSTGEVATYDIGADAAATPFKSLRKIDQGDIISVEDLMLLADPRGKALLDAPRLGGRTLRWDGAVMSVNIEYSNKALWDFFAETKPKYKMTAAFLPMKKYKIEYEGNMPNGRRRRDVHGLLILFRVSGSVLKFDITQLLTVLSTALVSLALAATVTDMLMMYVVASKEQYTVMKYQPTHDMIEQKEIQKQHGSENYDPPHTALLKQCVGLKCPPRDEELLHLLLKIEHRLNRLDGMDVDSEVRGAEDAGFRFVQIKEDEFYKRGGSANKYALISSEAGQGQSA